MDSKSEKPNQHALGDELDRRLGLAGAIVFIAVLLADAANIPILGSLAGILGIAVLLLGLAMNAFLLKRLTGFVYFVIFFALLVYSICPRLTSGAGDPVVAAISVAKSDIATLQSALETYKTDTGSYPTTSLGLQALINRPSDVSSWKGPYVDRSTIPTDPWGNQYLYEWPVLKGQDFLITSYGSDRKPGATGTGVEITSDDST